MNDHLAARLMDEYDRGKLSRRDVVAGLVGLGAAMAGAGTAGAQGVTTPNATFNAVGLDHIALNVTDVAKSRAFYEQHLGMAVKTDGGDQRCFLGPPDGDFILALFRSDNAGMNHYCYAIPDYNPDDVVVKLQDAGIEPRREGGRVYFPDPDGLTVQLAQQSER